jgi:hypothetical protein
MSTENDDDAKGIDDEATLARPKPRLVPSINDEPTVVGGKGPVMIDDPPLRSAGSERLRRMAPILAVLVVVLAMGPFISRFIDTYRAVVMDVDADSGKMMIQQPMRPPRWVSAIDAKPGTVVMKEPFSWNPHPVEATPKDAPQLELAQRWQSSYEGVIVELRPPNAPGRGAIAVVQTADGNRFEVSMFAEHLATASVGRVLHKEPSTWDPVMLPVGKGPSGTFSLTPKEPPKSDAQNPKAPKTDAPKP